MSSWAGLHEKPNVSIARVSHRVQSASRHVNRISHSHELFLACHTNCQRTFEHLDALVLSNVYVQWDPTAGIESHFQLEELAVSVAAGLKDGYVLAGENVMQMIAGGHEASLASEHVRRRRFEKGHDRSCDSGATARGRPACVGLHPGLQPRRSGDLEDTP
jgi:hypothetical protein